MFVTLNPMQTRLVMSLGTIKCYANGRPIRELPDMSNGDRTRKTTCDICLCLRKFLCSEVSILTSGNTIPNSIYFCPLFCDRRSGKCCCISKIQVFLEARYVVRSVMSWYWTCFGALSASFCRQTYLIRAFRCIMPCPKHLP